MIHESFAISALEYERSKRIFLFGSLLPTFIIHLIFILAVIYTLFTGIPSSGDLSITNPEIVLLKAFIWELEFLAMFHVTILMPWLFSENNLDVFLFKAISNPDILIIGKVLSIIKQQVMFILIFYSIGIIAFLLTIPISFSIIELLEGFIALLVGLSLTDLVVLAICLLVKRVLKSLQIGSTIVSLYLFAMPLLIVILLSSGFLPSELAIFNIPIQLQELNNYIITKNLIFFPTNWNLLAIILIELGISLVIVKKVSLHYE